MVGKTHCHTITDSKDSAGQHVKLAAIGFLPAQERRIVFTPERDRGTTDHCRHSPPSSPLLPEAAAAAEEMEVDGLTLPQDMVSEMQK